jgi:hypothetical protein
MLCDGKRRQSQSTLVVQMFYNRQNPETISTRG